LGSLGLSRIISFRTIFFFRREGEYHTLSQIDMALDTFPFSGHTTAMDSLWMGVPVVTVPGATSVGRAAYSALQNLGLAELVGDSADEFVAIAVGLSGDLAKLTEIRAELRQRMQTSPLMDGARFARNMEAVYRRMLRIRCDGSGA
jgi:protein O-GlcNAc transferase